MKTIALAAAAAAVSLFAGAAQAQQGLTPQAVTDWLTGAGLQPTLDASGEDPYVRVQDEQLTWLIFFYGCEAGPCESLQFGAGFTNETITLERVNQWNTQRRFLKAHYEPAQDNMGSAIVQYDVVPTEGAPISHLDLHLNLWRGTLADFGLHVGYFTAPEDDAAQ